MSTYALIHGAHHGAWCWAFLEPELRARGHEAIAVDLPVEDTTAAVSQYTKLVLEALADVDDDVVLVGHSLGGIIAPVVATRRPVRRLVYLAAPIPEPGRPLADQQRENPDMIVAGSVKIDNGDGTFSRTADEAIYRYYYDCTEERQRYAVARLRPQSHAPNLEPSPLSALPDVPASYLVCAGDRAVSPDFQRAVARERLGVEPVELPGSHSPFLARPGLLAEVLTGLS